MASWSEIDPKIQIVIVLVTVAALAGGTWYGFVRPINVANHNDTLALANKKTELAELQREEKRLAQLNQDLEVLKQKIEQQKRVVPDEKQIDEFIRLVHNEAKTAGIEIRRFTSQAVVPHDYYSEMPFELEIDGAYFSVLKFFERLSEMDRIVNISALQMATVKSPGAAKAKKTYVYAANESVVATCVATTYFISGAAPPPKKK